MLNGVSMSLPAGRVVALCGPNGAGKSSLLACLCGEYALSGGSVHYGGTAVSHLSAREKACHRVVLEQTPTLSAAFSLSELVELGAPLDLSPADLTQLKSSTLAELGFDGMGDRFVADLSGGQQHRAHLARVLIGLHAYRKLGHNCALFLDEPTSSLDIGHQINVLDRVRALAADGVGVLVVLHDLNLAAAFADEVVLLKEGTVVQTGAPEDVLTAQLLSAVYDTEILVETALNGQAIIQPRLGATLARVADRPGV
ncbi:MAG: ATP-binding cassette domain-containing protein [Pseudomonadota bacterium]